MRSRDVIILAAGKLTYLPARRFTGFRPQGGDQELSEEVTSSEGGESLLGSLCRRHVPKQRRPRRLEIRLMQPLVQLRELKGLPPVSESDLKRLISQRADHFFRREEHPPCTDAVWLGKSTPTLPGAALAAAVDPELLRGLEEDAKAHGWLLDRITVDGRAGAQRLRMRSSSGEADDRNRRRAGIKRLSLGAIATIACLMLAAFTRLELQSRRLAARLDSLRRPAEAASSLHRVMDEAEAMIGALERSRDSQGRLLAPLARVAGALPDSAILSSFMLDEMGKGELSGHAYRALEVLAALGKVDLGRTRVEGSLTRETISGHSWERFTIHFEPPTP